MMEEAGGLGVERTPLAMATRLYFLAFASINVSVVSVWYICFVTHSLILK